MIMTQASPSSWSLIPQINLVRKAALCLMLIGTISCQKEPEHSQPAPPTQVSRAAQAPVVNIVTLPGKYDGKAELPVLVTLHGMGGKASKFLGDEFEDIADDLKAVVIAVGAPLTDDRGGYAWSDRSDENLDRIRIGLNEAGRKAKLRKDHVVLLGYSQGAYAALGLAYDHPDVFAGVIALSPGSLTNPSLAKSASPLLAKRGFVLAYGDKDEDEFIRQGKERLASAQNAGAKVKTKVYANAEHLIPPDLDDRLPEWFAFVLEANDAKESVK
jgi:predicted esterase